MKRSPRSLAGQVFLLAALLSSLPTACLAADRATRRLDELLQRTQVELESLQTDPARAIPAEVLREAKGLVVLRETRAGFVLGARRGAGVVLLKEQGRWGFPRFVSASEGSIGLQAGWQKATFYQVLMTEAAVAALSAENFRFGVGLRVTRGPRTVGDEAKTQSPGADVLIYADTGGLFGGVALEGGTLVLDQKSNRAYYGYAFGPVEPVVEDSIPAPARDFRKLILRLTAGPPTAPRR